LHWDVLETAFCQNRGKRTWPKWIAEHLKGFTSKSYCQQISRAVSQVEPSSALSIFVHLCSENDQM